MGTFLDILVSWTCGIPLYTPHSVCTSMPIDDQPNSQKWWGGLSLKQHIYPSILQVSKNNIHQWSELHFFMGWKFFEIEKYCICAHYVQRNDTCPTVIPRIWACVKQVLIGWKLIFGYKVQRQWIHRTVERFSTNQTLGDILYHAFWLVKNRSTVQCICCCWTLYPKIKFQPIRTCLTHAQFRGMTVGHHSVGHVLPCIVWCVTHWIDAAVRLSFWPNDFCIISRASKLKAILNQFNICCTTVEDN